MREITHRQAVLLVLTCAVLWSLGGLLIKSVDWNPGTVAGAFAIAGGRSLIAAAVIWALAPRLRFTTSPHLWLGALAYAATVTLFVIANKFTTAANAIVLQYTAPVWVALFGWWFVREKPAGADWVTLGVVAGGMSLFFREGLQGGHLFGDAMALASGVSYAWLALFLRRQKDGARFETVVAGNLLTVVIALPFMVQGPFPSAGGWGALVLLGVFQLGVTYYLYARALQKVSALEASLLPILEPILNPIWVFFFLGERMTPLAMAGAAIVLGAITVRAWLAVRGTRPPGN